MRGIPATSALLPDHWLLVPHIAVVYILLRGVVCNFLSQSLTAKFEVSSTSSYKKAKLRTQKKTKGSGIGMGNSCYNKRKGCMNIWVPTFCLLQQSFSFSEHLKIINPGYSMLEEVLST